MVMLEMSHSHPHLVSVSIFVVRLAFSRKRRVRREMDLPQWQGNMDVGNNTMLCLCMHVATECDAQERVDAILRLAVSIHLPLRPFARWCANTHFARDVLFVKCASHHCCLTTTVTLSPASRSENDLSILPLIPRVSFHYARSLG